MYLTFSFLSNCSFLIELTNFFVLGTMMVQMAPVRPVTMVSYWLSNYLLLVILADVYLCIAGK